MKDFITVITYLAESRWTYLVVGLPFTIFLIVFYLKNKSEIAKALLNFIQWAKPSLETGGTSSSEKITAFMVTNFAYIPCRLIFTWKILTVESTDVWHIVVGLLIGSAIDAGYTLMLYKILSPQQLIELKNGLNIKEEKPDETKV